MKSAVPSLMRQMNERSVFNAVDELGPVSCAQLADATGISKPTVAQAIRSMEAAGLVRAKGRSSGGLGRTGLLYGVAADGGYVLAIDIGIRRVRVAVGDLTRATVQRRDAESPGNDLVAITECVAALGRDALRQAGASKRKVLAAVVGSPGAVDPRHPGLTHVGRLSCLDGVDLAAILSGRLGVPVSVENDVNLAALGEQAFGVSAPNMVVLSIGDGIGAALILDGRLIRGPRGAAGEIESVPFDRARGSGQGLLPESRGPLTRFVALRVSALAAITDAELVVLTGEVGLDPSLLEPVRRIVTGHLAEPPRLETSRLGEDGVLLGCLASAHAAALEQTFSQPLKRERSA